jgi:hypothetical protein
MLVEILSCVLFFSFVFPNIVALNFVSHAIHCVWRNRTVRDVGDHQASGLA